MSNFTSLVFYFLTFGISILAFSYYNNINRTVVKIGLTVAVLIPTFVAGFRYMVGTDYGVYYNTFAHYLNKQSYLWIITDSRHYDMERCFLLISKFVTEMLSAKAVFGVFALIIIALFTHTLMTQYRNFKLTILFFLFLFGPNLTSYNILRQSIALVISFWGLQFVFEGNIRKYLMAIICASFFHSSAVLAIPIYFLWNHKKEFGLSSIKKLCIYIVAIAIVVEWQPILNFLSNKFGAFFYISKYSRYLNAGNTLNRSFYLKLIWGVLFLLLEKRYIKFDKRFALFINMYMIGVILEYTGFHTPFIKRIGNYYSVYTGLMLSGTLPFVFYKYSNRSILHVAVISYEIIIFLITSFMMNQGKYFPYTC